MDPHTFIDGHERVVARFGRWPGFHDGEVHRILLDSTRTDAQGRRQASIELQIRGWNTTQEPTPQGLYRCEVDTLVHLLFEQVDELVLDGLNHQNVLNRLALSLVQPAQGTPQLKVELEHCFGISGSFVAASARVLSVSPYEPDGQRT